MTSRNSPGDYALHRTPDHLERWHVLVPAAALLFQLVSPLILWIVASFAYVQPNHQPQNWERPVSLLALFSFAAVSLVLGSVGVYGLLTRFRLRIAIPLIAICCIPALLAGAAYLHGMLVFLTWV